MTDSFRARAAIFDLDGTLADTFDLVISAYSTACEDYLGRKLTREEVMKLRAIDSLIDGHPNPGLGVHFFDALVHIFGPASTNITHLHDRSRAAGFLVCGNASIRWFLSVERNDLPQSANGKTTYRSMLIDGEVIATPKLRAPIGTSAVINGDFTQAEAERIANGMRIR